MEVPAKRDAPPDSEAKSTKRQKPAQKGSSPSASASSSRPRAHAGFDTTAKITTPNDVSSSTTTTAIKSSNTTTVTDDTSKTHSATSTQNSDDTQKDPTTPPQPSKTKPPTPPQRSPSPEWVISPSKQQYEDNVICIIRQVFALSDYAIHTFSIAKVPGTLTWGPADQALDDTLCHDSQPAIIAMAGEVDRPNFFEKDTGLPLKFASLRIKPIRYNDGVAAKTLLDRLATAAELRDTATILAGRKQTIRVRGPDGQKALPFKHLYDGSVGYRPSKELLPLDPKTLEYKDVVILEATVGRFRVDSNNKAVYTAGPWLKYRTSFTIVRILRLQVGVDDEEQEA
ncbi:hypothetical protein C8T65DRAFT_749991 [Cerioporus squamosus]|nr:hypothetical protein C8T65DRAFT_749991 [Cerioporus squamosus]